MLDTTDAYARVYARVLSKKNTNPWW